MKSIHITRMERLRSINLRIGFAAAILFCIFAFNWTTKRSAAYLLNEEETYPAEVVVKPFVVNQPLQRDMPKVQVLKPNDLIVEVPELTTTLQPALLPLANNEDVISQGGPGNVEPEQPKAPPIQLRPEEPEDGKTPWVIVEEMPRFPGCNEEGLTKKERQECAESKLLSFIYSKITYPEFARQNDIEGTVYLRFVVEKDGSISNASVLRDIGGGCGEESLRVVKLMPKWLPGKQRGNPVRVQFNLPVKFSLE